MTQSRYPIKGSDIIKEFRSLAAQGKTNYKERERRIGYSDPHIRSMCKHYFGQTSGEVFSDILLDVFRDFLTHCNWSIEEVCFWFNTSYRHMNVTYQKRFGEKMSATRHRASVLIYKNSVRIKSAHFPLTVEALEDTINKCVIDGKWKVAHIAREIGCSTVTLQSKSKALLGSDISTAVARFRAEFIRDCILHSNLSVYDIADLMGCERRCLSDIYSSHYGETITEARIRCGSFPTIQKGVKGEGFIAARYRAA